MTRSFPTIEEVVAIHDVLLSETGAAAGLRDMGALESALLRPQMGYYDGLIEEAAALMESLAEPSFRGRQQAYRSRRHRYLPPSEQSFHRLR